jgi:large subunit ribosomal protein L15
MQLHTLKRNNPNKKAKTVGRGGTRGKTAGRGTKGQNARAGHKKRPEIRDFIKRIPKLRGRGKNINTSIQNKPVPVSLSILNSKFKAGDSVSPSVLVGVGIVRSVSGNIPRVKILGGGSLDKKLSIAGCEISESARRAVEAVGGTVA